MGGLIFWGLKGGHYPLPPPQSPLLGLLRRSFQAGEGVSRERHGEGVTMPPWGFLWIGSLGKFRLGKVGMGIFSTPTHDPHRGLGPKTKRAIYLAMQFLS
jgi:hypothetical protein